MFLSAHISKLVYRFSFRHRHSYEIAETCEKQVGGGAKGQMAVSLIIKRWEGGGGRGKFSLIIKTQGVAALHSCHDSRTSRLWLGSALSIMNTLIQFHSTSSIGTFPAEFSWLAHNSHTYLLNLTKTFLKDFHTRHGHTCEFKECNHAKMSTCFVKCSMKCYSASLCVFWSLKGNL